MNMWNHPRARNSKRKIQRGVHGNIFAQVKHTVSALKRKIKKAIRRGMRNKHIFPLSLSSLLILLFHSFQDVEEKKTQAGEQWSREQVSVSRGTRVDKARLWEGEVGLSN